MFGHPVVSKLPWFLNIITANIKKIFYSFRTLFRWTVWLSMKFLVKWTKTKKCMRTMREQKACLTLTVFENLRKSLNLKIASEASYVYILSWQKFIKNAKNGWFWWFFDNATFFGDFQPLCLCKMPHKHQNSFHVPSLSILRSTCLWQISVQDPK